MTTTHRDPATSRQEARGGVTAPSQKSASRTDIADWTEALASFSWAEQKEGDMHDHSSGPFKHPKRDPRPTQRENQGSVAGLVFLIVVALAILIAVLGGSFLIQSIDLSALTIHPDCITEAC